MSEVLSELIVKITADAQELKKALAETDKAVLKTGKTVDKETKDWKKSFTDLGKAMVATGAVITAAFALTVKSAMEVESTKIAFKNLATQNKQSANEILNALKKASKGTISEYDLMLAANRSMVLGVARNTKDFTALMEVARDRAKTMGITTTQAFNDIVVGIGRGSRLILDNLGIIVNLEQANEKYAKTLGKTAEELTATERQQALLNEVLKQGQTTLDKTSQETMTTSESFQALKASVGDTLAQIGSVLLPTFKKVIDGLRNIVDSIKNWAKEHPALTKILVTFTSTLGIGLTVAGSLLLIIPKLVAAFNLLKTSLLLAGGAAKALWASLLLLPAVIQTVSSLAEAYDKERASQDEIIAQLGTLEERVLKFNDAAESSIGAWDGNTRAIKDTNVTLRSSLGLTVEVTKAEYEEAKAKAIQAKQTKGLDDVEKLLADTLGKVDDKTEDLTQTEKELKWVTDALARASETQMKSAQKHHDILINLLQEEYNEKLKILGLEEDGLVQELQDKIDNLNKQTKAEDEALEDQAYLNRKSDLERKAHEELILAQETNDYTEYYRAIQELEENDSDYQRTITRRNRDNQISALNEEIEKVRDSYSEKRDSLNTWYEDQKELLNKNLEEALARIEEETKKLEIEYGIREADTEEYIAKLNEIIDKLKDKTNTITTIYRSIHVSGSGGSGGAEEPYKAPADAPVGSTGKDLGGGHGVWISPVDGSIHPYAQGGIVDKPTLAMIGEGGEKEAIIPEHDWSSIGGGISVYFTDTVFLDREDSINRLVDKLVDKINKKQRFQFGNAYSG
jgi:hypothetical protein